MKQLMLLSALALSVSAFSNAKTVENTAKPAQQIAQTKPATKDVTQENADLVVIEDEAEVNIEAADTQKK